MGRRVSHEHVLGGDLILPKVLYHDSGIRSAWGSNVDKLWFLRCYRPRRDTPTSRYRNVRDDHPKLNVSIRCL
jgi:hypothetical protein